MFRKRGLAFNIFIFTAFLLISVITIVMGLLYFILPSYYLTQKQQNLERNSKELTSVLQTLTSEEDCARLISQFAEENNVTVTAYDEEGSLLPQLSSSVYYTITADSVTISESSDSAATASEKPDSTVTIFSMPGREEIKAAGEATFVAVEAATVHEDVNLGNTGGGLVSDIIATEFPRNGLIDSMVINMTLQPIDEAKTVIISLMPWLLLLAFVIALIAAWLFARKLTKPILQISGAAERMQSRQPDILSNVRSNDELGQLSRNLDGLYVSLCRNIRELQIEMDKVSSLEQSKTDFMRAAGHELKTPIATLNGMLEGMIDNVGTYKNHEKYLRECKQQTSRLARLVHEILLSSQLETAKDAVQHEDADISSLVNETAAMYEVLIKDKKLKLIKEPFDFICESDPHLLRQIFSNLISNAVNYTRSGGEILISFRQDEQSAVLTFENQCEQIEGSELSNLFEPFYTRSYSRDKTKSGTGLGLYITKKNLEALGLSYEVSSAKDNTEFGFKFSILFN